jgi:predicted Zn-dependent protease
MSYKVRSIRLAPGTPPRTWDLFPGASWLESDAPDDEALLKVPSGNDYHVDVRDGSSWRCISTNTSSCFLIAAALREQVRIARLNEERRQREARERAKAEAQALREQAEAAKKAAQHAERRAAELETANTI